MSDFDTLLFMINSPFTIQRLFIAVWVALGIFMDIKLFWMVVYQWKYGGDAGREYLRYGKNFLKNNCYNGNKGSRK